MLQEPLLVVAAFYILFFTVIIYVRLDFAITKVQQHLRLLERKPGFCWPHLNPDTLLLLADILHNSVYTYWHHSFKCVLLVCPGPCG